MDADYKKALQRARRDLAHAIQQRDEWFLKIVKAQSAVRALAAMVGDAETELDTQVGISHVVQAIVNGRTGTISAPEVREGLVFYGYDLSRYANPASMISQTLERLADAGKIKRTADGKYTRSVFYELKALGEQE